MTREATVAARSTTRRALALVLAPCLSGCILTTEAPTGSVVDVPPKYRAASGKPYAALPAPDWWRGFRSGELTMFVERAYLANFDIAAAVARIEQADAQTRIAGAPLLPTVNFDGAVTRAGTGTTPGTTTYRAVLNASYELDFWGKNRAALRAAEFNAIASRFDREVIALSTVATVINTYFQVLAAQCAQQRRCCDAHSWCLSGAHRGRHRHWSGHCATAVAACPTARLHPAA